MNIKNIMTRDHKNGDLMFAESENAVTNAEWKLATSSFIEFMQAMQHHLGIEEQVLFPAFENATGMVSGPTEVMRMEHEQMRTLLTEMNDAMQQQDSDDYLGFAETLLILMQQHNTKEEQILYNMLDQALPDFAAHWQEQFDNWKKTDVG